MSSKITALTALASTQTDDVLPIVDVHDTTMAASGTTKQITVANLQALLAPKASPTFTGAPTAPTATALTSSTQLATTAYADAAVGVENVRALAAEALLAPLASPGLTGTPTAPTKSALTNSTALATTAYADAAVGVETTRALAAEALLAPKASPALTGTPTAPTATALTSTTQVATTAYADSAVGVEKSRALAAEALALPLAGGTMSGAIAMGSHKVTGLTNGSAASDAAAWGQTPAGGATVTIVQGGTGQTTAAAALTALGAAALQGASVSYKPASPTATASTTLVTMGIGATCVFTPAKTGKVKLTVNGAWLTATTTVQGGIGARYGTGTAPVNGAADTGTAWGTNAVSQNIRAAGTGGGLPFAFTEIVSLTPATAYWFDLVTGTNTPADVATITNIVMTVEELPS